MMLLFLPSAFDPTLLVTKTAPKTNRSRNETELGNANREPRTGGRAPQSTEQTDRQEDRGQHSVGQVQVQD